MIRSKFGVYQLAMDRIDVDEQFDRSEKNIGTAEYYIQQLNVNNAKKVALCLVLGFICYHGLIHLRYGMSYVCDRYFRSVIFR